MKIAALFLLVMSLYTIPAFGFSIEGAYSSEQIPGILVFSPGGTVVLKTPGEPDHAGTYQQVGDKLIIDLDGAEEFLIDPEGNFSVTIFDETIQYNKRKE